MTVNHRLDSNIQNIADQWHVLLRSASLSDQQEKDFFTWLNSSPDHQRAYLEAEELWWRGGALEQAIVRADKENHEDQHPQHKRNKLYVWPYATAFAACIILAMAIFSFNLGQPEQAFKHYQTSLGEQKTIVLDDGSIATLNTNSLLTFNPNNARQRALALDNGEVFFDVKPNQDKPFTVKTNDGMIVVLGTQFSINKKSGSTEITVIEGTVGLLPGIEHWQGQTPKIQLTKNQTIELSEKSPLEPQTIDANKSLSWRSGKRYYEQQTLAEVIEDLNRYYAKSFVIGDESLKSKRVVAMIPISNSFDKTRMLLEKTLRLRTEVSSNQKNVILLPNDKLP